MQSPRGVSFAALVALAGQLVSPCWPLRDLYLCNVMCGVRCVIKECGVGERAYVRAESNTQ